MNRAAVISPCGRYRYVLERQWRAAAPAMTIVMLNPSTADANTDDPTISRCIGFALREAFGGIRVLNLFALRATDPRELMNADDPVGPDNDDHLRRWIGNARRVVAAWGRCDQQLRRDRVAEVLALLPDTRWLCFDTTKDGHPRHPLYLPSDEPLRPFPAKAGVV